MYFKGTEQGKKSANLLFSLQ